MAYDLRAAEWRKSSYSSANGQCVEAAALGRAEWRKSSYSGGNGDCVEVAELDRVVGIRDSKDREGPALVFDADQWTAFVNSVTSGNLTG